MTFTNEVHAVRTLADGKNLIMFLLERGMFSTDPQKERLTST